MPNKYQTEFHWTMLVKVHDEGVNLTEWESKFIADLFNRFTVMKRTWLTEKQEAMLEKIYTDKTG